MSQPFTAKHRADLLAGFGLTEDEVRYRHLTMDRAAAMTYAEKAGAADPAEVAGLALLLHRGEHITPESVAVVRAAIDAEIAAGA